MEDNTNITTNQGQESVSVTPQSSTPENPTSDLKINSNLRAGTDTDLESDMITDAANNAANLINQQNGGG